MAMAKVATLAMVRRNSIWRRQPTMILSDWRLHTWVLVAWSVALVAPLQSARAQFAVSPAPSFGGLQGLRIQPSLTVSEVFSDNVSLAAAGAAKSEWTTRIRPLVTVTETGPRLRLNATYSPDLLYRANQGNTDVSHFLSVLGSAELLQRLLYVDVRTGISQQNVSLIGSQADSNLNTTGNRTNVKTYSISPYLRHDFGYDASGELRFTHDGVSYGGNSNTTSASTSNRINAQLASGPSFQLFTWGLALSKAHLEYTQTGQKIDSQSISATAGRLIAPNLRLNATGGYEDSGYPATNGRAVKGAFWSLGPKWTPSPRTTISASLGHKYYGASKSFNLEHRSSLTTWEANYSENVTTARSTALGSGSLGLSAATIAAIDADVQLRFPNDPAGREAERQRQLILNASLTQPVNFLTDSLFLEKRLQVTVGIRGVRNTVIASAFTSNRDAFSATASTSGDFARSQNTKQGGASLTWASRLTQTLAANTTLGITRNSLGLSTGVNRLTFLRFGLTEQFGPRLNGSLLLSRQKNDSTIVGGTSYTENSVSATLGLRY
jgi:uncharacterized protein (PEP-CTERM system associated)